MNVEAVLFDLDGTLLDTAPDFELAINLVLSEEGMPPLNQDTIRMHVGNGSAGIICNVFNILRDDPAFLRLQQSLLAHYKANLTNRTHMFPGLETSMNLLETRNIAWGVVTNKPSEYAAPIMQSLLPDSQVLVCPDHVEKPKPDPEGILLACREINAAAERCLYIGDHLRDIQAGQAAGTPTIAVGWGYIGSEESHTEWSADWTADNPADLAPLLQTIFDS